MGNQRPIVSKPFMIIGGHNDSRDGEVVYQDCFYGELGPMTRSVFLPEPSAEFDKVMDLSYLSRYGTPEIEQRESMYYEYEADCVARYGPAGQGVSKYWFYRLANDLTYKERYTADSIWRRLHEFYKSLDKQALKPASQPATQPHERIYQVHSR